MAGAIYCAATTAEVALASSSAKTLIRLISSTNSAVKIKEWGVFFDGILSTDPPAVVTLLHTNTSNGLYTAHTPSKRMGPAGIVARTVCETMNTSSESTWLGTLSGIEVHTQGGYQEKFAYGDEIVIANGSTASNGTICLQVNSPSSVNARAIIVFEE